MKRRWLIAGSVLLVAAVLLAAGAAWLVRSEGGNRWLLERAVAQSGGRLTIEGARGRLADGMTIARLEWRDGDLAVVLEELSAVARLSFLPLELTVDTLDVGRAHVHQPAAEGAGDGPLPLAPVLESLALPFPVDLRALTLGPVERSVGAAEPVHLVDLLTAQGRWFRGLDGLRVEAEGPMFAGGLEGAIDFSAPFAHRLHLELRGADDAAPSLALDLESSGSDTVVSGRLERPRVTVDGRLRGWAEAPRLDLRVEAPRLPVGEGVSLDDLAATLTGTPEDYRFDGGGQLLLTGRPPSPFAVRGGGTGDGLTVETAQFTVPVLGLSATGTTALAWSDGRLRVPWLRLAADDDDFELAGEGAWNPDTEQGDATLRWTGLDLPIGRDGADWGSERGTARLTGRPADWSLAAEFLLRPAGAAAELGLTLNAAGDAGQARYDLAVDGDAAGRARGAGQARWDLEPRFDWAGTFESLNLAALDAAALGDWPSRLDGAGAFAAQDGGFTLDIERLDGTLRGEPLAARGMLQVGEDRWRASEVRLESGGALLAANGGLRRPGGLALEVRLPSGSALATALGGDAAGTATLFLEDDVPRLRANLRGGGWRRGELAIGAWSLAGDSATDGLRLDLAGIAAPQPVLDAATLDLSRAGSGWRLAGNLVRGETRAELQLVGDGAPFAVLAGEASPVVLRPTQGRLTSLSLRRKDERLLDLVAPAPWSVAADALRWERACLRTVGAGQLCAAGSRSSEGELAVDGTVERVGFVPLLDMMASALTFEPVLSGRFSLRQGDGPPSGALQLDLGAGYLRSREDPELFVELGASRVDFLLDSGRLTRGVLDIPLPGVGSVDVDLAASEVRLDGSGRLGGKARMDIDDLSALQLFVPDLDDVDGRLYVELDIGGVTAEPIVDGILRLEDAAFAIPWLGLSVTALTGEGYARGQGEAVLEADFRIGDGAGRLVADVDLTPGAGAPVSLRIDGERLRLFDTPDIQLDANPQLELDWAGEEWVLGGRLEVPWARLTPIGAFVSRISESEDVEVVAGEPPPSLPPPVYADDRFYGAVDLVLGEDVRLETEQAKANIDGSLALAWDGTPLPEADGRLRVNGEVALFGPVLRIDDGVLRFPNVPVANPVLDLSAERDVFGNTQVRSAGVLITGTARKPVIEAYTRPFTTRDRAWALLLTGQDFDQGQNISALEVGTYIAPRIYVGYGVSLFEEGNVASVRYDLRRGFGIKATSGEAQSGLDISYTVER